MSRTSFTTGVWLLDSISKKIRNDEEGNLPFKRSSFHVENYVIQSQPDDLWKYTTLTYYAFFNPSSATWMQPVRCRKEWTHTQ